MQIWDWLRSLQMKLIDVEHHMVPKHSQTSILKPQYSCQQPRPWLPRHPYATRTDTCTTRLIISHPNILFPSRPATITLVWVLKVFPDVHTGLGQFGKPFSFNLNTLVTLVHDAIQGQPLARHAKIKEQFEKMESEGKTCWQYKPTAWCSDMTIREARKNLESV